MYKIAAKPTQISSFWSNIIAETSWNNRDVAFHLVRMHRSIMDSLSWELLQNFWWESTTEKVMLGIPVGKKPGTPKISNKIRWNQDVLGEWSAHTIWLVQEQQIPRLCWAVWKICESSGQYQTIQHQTIATKWHKGFRLLLKDHGTAISVSVSADQDPPAIYAIYGAITVTIYTVILVIRHGNIRKQSAQNSVLPVVWSSHQGIRLSSKPVLRCGGSCLGITSWDNMVSPWTWRLQRHLFLWDDALAEPAPKTDHAWKILRISGNFERLPQTGQAVQKYDSCVSLTRSFRAKLTQENVTCQWWNSLLTSAILSWLMISRCTWLPLSQSPTHLDKGTPRFQSGYSTLLTNNLLT